MFTARDFGELPNGVCRIAAPLTHELALTLPHWRECLGRSQHASPKPFAIRFVDKAQRLAPSRRDPEMRRASPGAADRRCSPRLAKPRSRDPTRRGNGVRQPSKRGRANPVACAMCGEPVLKRRRRHCEACMPKARREHGLRAIEAARKALAAQAAAGNDPRRNAAVNRARGEAISEGHRRNRRWACEYPGSATRRGSGARSRRSSMHLRSRRSAAATGLSLAACSRIRVGARVPHPRHWDRLLALVEAGN